ncbi:MAG: flippase-like domain-containing protein [Nitrosopumilus sp.]|nr:flippase-like domain-containing protein [Nitrosopumilus sp.]
MSYFRLMKGSIVWIILSSIILYVVIIIFSDISKISEQFIHAKIELVFLVFGIVVLSHIIKMFRQKELLHMLDEKITLKQNFVIYLAGLSLIFTPGGIGVFIKAHFLKQKFDIENDKSFPVIFLERFHDLLGATTIIFASLVISFNWLSASLVVISSFLVLGIYLLISNLDVFSFVQKKLSKIKFVAEKLPKFSPNDSFFILTRPKSMTKGWLISIAGWTLDSLAVYVGFLAFGIDLGYVLTSQIYFTSLGYGILSLIPGGIGVTEGIAEYMLVKQGLAISVASSIVIFTRLATIWFATSVGIISTRFAFK